MVEISRRKLMGHTAAGIGSALLLSRLTGESVALAAPDAPDARSITLREGTNFSAAVSPDGRTVVFDLLLMLWVVPVAGGAAVRLSEVVQEFSEPDIAPDGRRVVCQSYEDGQFRLVLLNIDGSGRTVLTKGPADCREPRFSPDGTKIAFSGESGGRYAIRVLDLATGKIVDWTTGTRQEGHPVWSPDGSTIAFTSGTNNVPQAIEAVDAAGNRRTLAAVTEGQVAGPSFAPDGTLSYVHLPDLWETAGESSLIVGDRKVSQPGEDVFPFAARWLSRDELLYTADGRIQRRNLRTGAERGVPFTAKVSVRPVVERPSVRDFDATAPMPVKGLVGPALSPDGKQVACRALGGDIWLLRPDRKPEPIIADGNFNSDPAWSPDGRTLVYSSDRAGQDDLWLHDLATGEQRQLTSLTGNESGPAFSPDGSTVAFVSGSSVYTVTVATGEVRKIGSFNGPRRPSFSGDGTKLSLAGFVPTTARFREGVNQVLTVDLATGAAHYTPPMPGKSLTSWEAGSVYSPDGRHMAFIVSGTVWVSDVDSDGRPSGQPRQVSDETGDFPSWSGDSRTLCYLASGRLRLADWRTGAVQSMPTQLTWRPQRSDGDRVIRAGALWDGEQRKLRRNVEILVRDNRIVAVGRGVAVPGVEVIDARELTVLPGLIATHEHVPSRAGGPISRLWLSFGVTTVRSPGSGGHYKAVEAKEAQESGKWLGPRVFCAGAVVDGGRIGGSTRPITDSDELRRELDLVGELGHDMVKTYVRLPYSLQQEAIEQAHARGVPVSSHYVFGPAALGADAVEHIGGTSRYAGGFEKIEKRTYLGRSYADVVDPLVRSGMGLTATHWRRDLVAYAEWALDDPRLKALLSATTYQQFRTDVEEAHNGLSEAELAFTANEVATLRRIIDGGGHVGIGTDGTLLPQGIFYYQQMDAMVRNGISPYDTLRAATVGGARLIGMSKHLGTVAPGKLADLVFVQGNPLADITAAARVRQVMLGGALHTVDDLIGSPAAEPAAKPAAAPSHTFRETPQQAGFWWNTDDYLTDHTCC